ncbi:hypothetical protein ACVGVM_10850 [Pseudonocardia bannensis]|uniref:hypothetical protein n=1 Tax=Pseudonocardia bannensis TaxID=630973 RepID=UPI001B7CEE3C|nr:hypothetical protein [Pseudonocardia bannensis]
MDERQREQDPSAVVVGVDGTRLGLRAAAEARVRGLPPRIVHAAPYATGCGEPPEELPTPRPAAPAPERASVTASGRPSYPDHPHDLGELW